MIRKAIIPLILLAAICFLLGTILLQSDLQVPPFEQVKQEYRQSDRVLLDYRGQVLDEIRVDPSGRRLQWVTLAEISPSLVEMVVLAEDKRFWDHNGVDWYAVASGFWQIVVSGQTRGASTITMQLASILSPELRPEVRRRSLSQKWRQMRLAWSLEETWTKKEILEAYLNRISFRGELEGVRAATRGLLRKSPHGVTVPEALIMAALIRAPNASPEDAAQRAEELAKRAGFSFNTLRDMALEILNKTYFVEPQERMAPLVAKRLFAGIRGRDSVRSSLDKNIQQFANLIVRQHLMELRDQNVRDAALIVVENKSGAIRAYAANGADLSSARHVDGIRSIRQAGSTLKPFLYAEAFSRKILTPASLLDDTVLNVPVTGGIYRPSNYDHLHRGPVSCRVALASSLNIPAVRVLDLVGQDVFVSRLRSLGFDGLEEAEFYGPSIALGSADVSLWNLVNAYRVFSNDGYWSPISLLHNFQNIENRKVFSKQVCYLISTILSDRESRSSTFSLESPLSTRFWTAVKTGTSKDMRDNWCIGYSSDFTVGAWVGNFSGEPMWNVSGISGAAPLWVEMMNFLHKDKSSEPPVPPTGIQKQMVRFSDSAMWKEEWFLEGTDTDQVIPGDPQTLPGRIAYPAAGTVVVLDPDIPTDQQKMYFEASPPSDSFHWFLDEENLGTASNLLVWAPSEGIHQLKLVEEKGIIVDQVTFFVRGFQEEPELEKRLSEETLHDPPSQ